MNNTLILITSVVTLSIVNNMCFTVLLSSWLVFQVVPLSTCTEIPNYEAPVDNVTLIYYKKPSAETEPKLGDDLAVILRALGDVLNDLQTIPPCGDGDKTMCFTPSKCPGRTESANHTMAKREAITQVCQTLVFKGGEFREDERPSSFEVWSFGMLSVGIISLSGLCGGLLWPLINSKYYDHAMRALIGLAVGTLCSTSSLQLLPQGFGIKEGDFSYFPTAVTILISLWTLYMFEVICKIIFYTQTVSENGIQESTHESFKTPVKLDKEIIMDEGNLLPRLSIDSNTKSVQKTFFSSHTSLHKISAKHLHSHTDIQMGGIAPVAWMVILGDGLHNFVDGMSIGAGFSQSLSVGMSISIAIACEEFPHELGDFAILVNSGMTIKRALLYNFLSALTAFAGLVVGILLRELEASTYIFAFSGGLFLYISLTDLMPELNGMVTEGLKRSKKNALLVLLEQNCGILLGFVLLCIIPTLSTPLT